MQLELKKWIGSRGFFGGGDLEKGDLPNIS